MYYIVICWLFVQLNLIQPNLTNVRKSKKKNKLLDIHAIILQYARKMQKKGINL